MSKYNIKKHNFYIDLNNYNNKNNKICLTNIKQNINLLDDKEKNIIINKYLSNNEKNNIILKYELENFKTEKKYFNLKDFDNLINYLFKRYFKKVGGNYFEYPIWKKYILNYEQINNQEYFIYYNFINNDLLNNSDTLYFLKNIFNLFNNLSNNFKIKIIKFENERDYLTFIYFIFVKYN